MGTGSGPEGPSSGIHLTNRQIYGFAFANNFCIAILYLNLPLRALTLGADAFHLGLIGGIWSLSAICAAVLCGRLSDRIGRDGLMALGPLLSGLATLSILAIPKLGQVFLVAAAMGVSSALFWPSIEAKVADISGRHEMGDRLSRFNVSWSSGSGLGTVLSGVIAEQSALLPFWVAAALSLALGLRLAALVRAGEKGGQAGPHPPAETHPPHRQAAAFLFMARLVFFGLTFTIGSIRWLFPKLAVSLGMGSMAVGVVLWMVTGAQALGFLGMAFVRRWQYAFGALLLTLTLPLAGLLLAWRATTPVGFSVAFFAVGLSSGLAFNLSLFYSVHAPHGRGGNAGLHEAIGGLGWMLGPLLGGVVARQVSLPATYLLNLAAVALVLAAVLVYRYRLPRHSKRVFGHFAA